MNSLRGKQLIILIAIFLVFLIGGIFYWSSLPKKKIETPPEKKEENKKVSGLFSITAEILEVNVEGKYLTVKSAQEEKELKVILAEDTKIITLKFPFDSKSPPLETAFTLEEAPIKITDLKVGDQVLIQAEKDITGQTEFGNINQIQVLPQ